VGDLPSDFGESSTNRPPPSGQWTQAQSTQPSPRARTWPAVALAAIALVVAVAALIVAITKPTPPAPQPRTTVPAYPPAEMASARRQLCDTYNVVARAVGVDTNGGDKALARIALTNAAVMLGNTAANPALDFNSRDAAHALATAYLIETAKSSSDAFTDSEFRAALDDVAAKDAAMKKVCGGG
jgi:hypothetical protein